MTTRPKTNLRDAFNNNTSIDLKRSKAQISKMIKSGGFLGSLLSKLAGQFMKIAIRLVKNILASLGITAVASAIDARIKKKNNKKHGSGTTILIISNEEMNDIMKVAQALEDSNILLKGVTKTIKNEKKEQKGGFLTMLLGTLGASSLGNLLTGKGIVRVGTGNKKGKGIVRGGTGNKKGEGIVRAGTGKQWDF